ncbi:MAG TPA: hypothetical protein VI146_05775 [Nitrososphaeraceae archaeon]
MTFINDNKTIIGSNYSAWQVESISPILITEKMLTLWTVKGIIGYKFIFSGPPDFRFGQYLNGFKNMLKSVVLSTPTTEKKPSFLNSDNAH